MEYCKEWIELYKSKRSRFAKEHVLFCKQNPRGTPLPAHIRDKNWPTEYSRSWLREAIDEKQRQGDEYINEDVQNIAIRCNQNVIIINLFICI